MTHEYKHDEDQLLTEVETSREYRKSIPWLQRQRWAGTGPKFIKIGRTIFYRRRDWHEYLDAQLHVSTRAKAVRGEGEKS